MRLEGQLPIEEDPQQGLEKCQAMRGKRYRWSRDQPIKPNRLLDTVLLPNINVLNKFTVQFLRPSLPHEASYSLSLTLGRLRRLNRYKELAGVRSWLTLVSW
jgi:hypothetical protein